MPSTDRIHATAIIDPQAELAEDVVVGPFAVVEGAVRVGPGSVLRPHAQLIGPLVLGRENIVFGGAVLGERPQHLKYNDEPTSVEIGDGNIFRENVTVHRGTALTGRTRIGDHNFFMASSHVAHDCVIGSHCVLANNALLAGHCELEDSVTLSGNTAVHQFVRMGRLSLLSGNSATGKDLPPFVMQQGLNTVVGVNVVGMRRAGLSRAQIDAVHRAYQILFRQGLTLPNALARIEAELGAVDVAREMIQFIRHSKRGINLVPHHHRFENAA